MSTRVGVVDGIIAAVAILVQAVDGFGIQVIGAVGADEASPLGGVVPGAAVVQAGIFVVVATVTNGVGVGNIIIGSLRRNSAVAPGITYILPSSVLAVKKKPPRSNVTWEASVFINAENYGLVQTASHNQ